MTLLRSNSQTGAKSHCYLWWASKKLGLFLYNFTITSGFLSDSVISLNFYTRRRVRLASIATDLPKI